MHMIEHAILSTDLAVYFRKKNRFITMVENGEFDWQDPDQKSCNISYTIMLCHILNAISFEVLCGMMMTGCDVSAIAKPWSIQHRVAKLVAEEFFEQGDMEKLQLNETPIVMI
jgi:cGMP-specific 3',5'-cyclic phosphodiesterase